MFSRIAEYLIEDETLFRIDKIDRNNVQPEYLIPN